MTHNLSIASKNFIAYPLEDQVGLRPGRSVDLKCATQGGLLCLGSLEEREIWAPWLVFLVSTFPFSQATQAE